MWQSKRLSTGVTAAEIRRQGGRNPLWQPDPGGQWVAGVSFVLNPLFLQDGEGEE